MKLWKIGLTTGACAVACAAPLAFAPLAAGLTFAGAGLACVGEIGVAALVLLIAVGLWFWYRHSTAKKHFACSPDGGCSTGPSCDVPSTT